MYLNIIHQLHCLMHKPWFTRSIDGDHALRLYGLAMAEYRRNRRTK